MLRSLRVAAAIGSIALLGSLAPVAPSASAGPVSTDPPVVFVHGFFADDCPTGLNVAAAMGGPTSELAAAGWSGRLDVVAYYACDHGGSRIGSDTTGTSIRRIGAQLARYIYRTYTVYRQPVDIVAHSMGGLVARAAIAYTAAHAFGFPPTLLVHRVVTFSSPFRGVSRTAIREVPGLAGTRQARQVRVGSAFLTSLAGRHLLAGTDWLAVGSSGGCDLVPGASAVDLPGAVRLRYTGCWTHTQYLYVMAQTRSYAADRDGTSTLTYGSLKLMRRFVARA